MANLDLQSPSVMFINVPGRPDQSIGVWLLTMQSTSDTVTVPELLTRSASNDQSSARVLSPATGVTVNAAATSGAENILTIAGSSEASQVILLTVHRRGKA